MTRALAVVGVLAATGCGDKEDPASPGNCEINEAVSYDGQVSTLFDKYCTRCHSSTASNRNGAPADVNFDTFTDASTSAERANGRIQAGTMPPNGGAVSTADRCAFQAWIDQGSTEN